MKRDVIETLKAFTTDDIKNGDLVITAEIHRVVDKDWGKTKMNSTNKTNMLVATEWPDYHKGCEHVMHVGPGQHGVFKLIMNQPQKGKRNGNRIAKSKHGRK